MKSIRRKLGIILALVLLLQEIFGCIAVSGTEAEGGKYFDFLTVQEAAAGGMVQQPGNSSQDGVTDLTNRGGTHSDTTEGSASLTVQTPPASSAADPAASSDPSRSGSSEAGSSSQSSVPDAAPDLSDPLSGPASSNPSSVSDSAASSDPSGSTDPSASDPSGKSDPSASATPSDAAASSGAATPSDAASEEVQTVYWAVNGTELKISSFPQEGEATGEFPADRTVPLSNWNNSNSLWGRYTIKTAVIGDADAGDIVKPEKHMNWFWYLQGLETIEFRGIDTSAVTDLSCLFYLCSSLGEISGIGSWDTSSVTAMRGMFESCSSLTTLDISSWDTSSVTDMRYMFESCRSLTTLDISSWDTSSVTDMSQMFESCRSLTSLDISSWDTSSVTNMWKMFWGCNLTTLDISRWDTSSVTDMNQMFAYCSSLTTLGIGSWNTASVTGMYGMFNNCSSLTSLDISSWDTSSVTRMGYMFASCSSLTSLDISSWDTSSVQSMYGMFSGCSGLTSLNIGDWDTSSVTDIRRMFYGCSGLTILEVENWDTSSVIYMGGYRKYYYRKYYEEEFYGAFSGCSSLKELDLANWVISQDTDISALFSGCTGLSSLKLKELNITSNQEKTFFGCSALSEMEIETLNVQSQMEDFFSEARLKRIKLKNLTGTTMKGLFSYCGYLEEINIEHFDASAVTDMSKMFYWCYWLSTLNVGNWDVSSVTDMSDMFEGCRSLKTLDVGDWDVSSVTDMSHMFCYCSSLKTLDIGKWDVSSVTDMCDMFYDCSSMETLNIGGWDVSSVTDMRGMFGDCSSMKTLDIGDWDVSSVTAMDSMFNDCRSLKTLDIGNWDVSSVTEMDGMFSYCSSMETLDIGKWDVSSVTDMADMFSYCSSLQVLNLDRWIISSETRTACMFYKCSDLTLLNLGEWNVTDKQKRRNMFWECTNLKTVGIKQLGVSSGQYGVFSDIEHLTSISIDAITGTSLAGLFSHCDTLVTVNMKNWDTSSVVDMAGLFGDCGKLKSLDLSGWDTSSVTNMGYMFSGCSGLTTLNIEGWNTSSVTDIGGMFSKCSGLTTLDVGSWDTSSVTNMGYMFSGCSGLTTLDVGSWGTSSVTNMGYMFSDCSRLTTLNIKGWNTSFVTDMSGMFCGCSGLTMLNVGSWDTSSVTNMGDLFFGCSGLTTLDVGSWDISSVTNMGYMFSECSGLKALNIGGWNTSAVIDMRGMLSGCKGLNTLDLNEWDVHSVKYMGYNAHGNRRFGMFSGCSGLKTLNIGNWDTSSVTDMSGMFCGCSGLTMLNIGGWNTSSVMYMSAMFHDCSGLMTLNIGGWNTTSVISMGAMFSGCKGLNTLDLNAWNMHSVKYLSRDSYGMFSGCSGLQTLNIGNWDTSSVTEMRYMFSGCSGLTKLNIEDWNTSSVTDMTRMFIDCSGLTLLDIGNWDFSFLKEKNYMFYGCSNLNLIRFPKGIKTAIYLPSNGTWYYNGTAVKIFPMNTAEPGIVTRDNTKTVVFSYLNQKGSWTSSVSTVNPGGGAAAPTVPEQVGSNVFAGWQNNLYQKTTESMEVRALYVTCEDPASVTWHTLRFFDGSFLFSEQKAMHGTAGQDPGKPVSDQTFTGWSGSYACITKDTILFARYQGMKTVTFSVGSGSITREFMPGETIVYPTEEELDGLGYGNEAAIRAYIGGQEDPHTAYESIIGHYQGLFLNWGEAAPSVMPEENVTITAEVLTGEEFRTWARRLTGLEFTVTFTEYDGTEESYTVLRGGFITAPAAKERAGYEFLYWQESGGSTVKAGWKVAGVMSDLSYTAVYDSICKVTFVYYNAAGIQVSEVSHVKQGGTAEAPAIPQSVTRTINGTEVTLRFTGWDKPLTGITGDTVITAQYQGYYPVSFLVGGETIVKYFAPGESIVYPTDAELEAIGYGTEASIRAYINGGGQNANLQNTNLQSTNLQAAAAATAAAAAATASEAELSASSGESSAISEITVGRNSYGISIADITKHFKGVVLGWGSAAKVMPACAVSITAETKQRTEMPDWLRDIFGCEVTLKAVYNDGTGRKTQTCTISVWYETIKDRAKQLTEAAGGVDYLDSKFNADQKYQLNEEKSGINDRIITDKTVTLYYYEKFTVIFTDYDKIGFPIYETVWGESVTAPADRTKSGCMFKHWLEADGSILRGGEKVIVRKDLNYTAVYSKVWNVSFTHWDGTRIAFGIVEGRDFTAPAGMPKPGYVFECWQEKNGMRIKAGTMVFPLRHLEFTAIYIKECVVSFRYHNGTKKNYDVLQGDMVTAPAGTERDGYQFICWRGEDGSSLKAGESVTVNDDITYTEEYKKVCSVTFRCRSAEDGNYKETQIKVVEGETAEPPVFKKIFTIKEEGQNVTYEFTGWDQPLENIIGDITITAQYSKKSEGEAPGEEKPGGENDGTVLEAVEVMADWYLNHVSTYLCVFEKNDQGEYRATEAALQYKTDYLKTKTENGVERIAESNEYVTLTNTGRAMYRCELLKNFEQKTVGDDCTAFGLAVVYLATAGAFESNLNDMDSGNFATSDKFEKCGFVRYNAADMELQDLQPGDILVDRHEKTVIDKDGNSSKRPVGHVEFIVSAPDGKTFGWGQVQNIYPKKKTIYKLETGYFGDGYHIDYRWVLRKVD